MIFLSFNVNVSTKSLPPVLRYCFPAAIHGGNLHAQTFVSLSKDGWSIASFSSSAPGCAPNERIRFGGDAEDLAYLVVAEVFKPQQHDGSVKRLQTRDTPMKLVHSLRSFLLRVEEVDVHCQRHGLATTLVAIERNTGVERHAVYPSTQGFVAPPDTSAVRARR